MTDVRLSQVLTEILRTATSPTAQMSQVALEVLQATTPPPTGGGARLSQHAAEALGTTVPPARLTQHVLEVLAPLAAPITTARLAQHVLEPLAGTIAAARLTQHVLETIGPYLALPVPPLPVPGTTPPSGTVQLTLQLQAELLLEDGRIPLTRRLALPGEVGDVVEVVLTDGTVNQAVMPGRAGQVVALLVASDKAVQVCVGDVTQNQPLTLLPWGAYLLLNSDMPGEQTCALSYTPGDGSTATCVVLVLIQARA